MDGPRLSPVLEGERGRALAALVSAFTHDPVERWLFPDDQAYLTRFPEFVAAFGGPAFADRTASQLDDFAAVALWLGPGAEADEDAIVTILSESVAPEQHADMFAVLEQMGEAHPEHPHWYLPWFGVALERQGAGLGAELMELCLPTVDATHLPVYLETPNPRTVPFYERHGFAVTGRARAGECPPMTMMLRPGR